MFLNSAKPVSIAIMMTLIITNTPTVHAGPGAPACVAYCLTLAACPFAFAACIALCPIACFGESSEVFVQGADGLPSRITISSASPGQLIQTLDADGTTAWTSVVQNQPIIDSSGFNFIHIATHNSLVQVREKAARHCWSSRSCVTIHFAGDIQSRSHHCPQWLSHDQACI